MSVKVKCDNCGREELSEISYCRKRRRRYLYYGVPNWKTFQNGFGTVFNACSECCKYIIREGLKRDE